MVNLSQYVFIKDHTQYKQHLNALKGFEICHCVWLIRE